MTSLMRIQVKIKKIREEKLVRGINVTDVEAKVTAKI
jgi:hypothetical protein